MFFLFCMYLVSTFHIDLVFVPLCSRNKRSPPESIKLSDSDIYVYSTLSFKSILVCSLGGTCQHILIANYDVNTILLHLLQ